ncbi:MAG TPA: hypothetical protein VFU11_10165 [Solirubrobacterales bacterium]|nr:hypothetical protein [Solirubrobacterales bacterium]
MHLRVCHLALFVSLLSVGLLAAAGSATADEPVEVLVVGDRLAEAIAPDLESLLPQFEFDVDAGGDRNSVEVTKAFEKSYRPAQRIVVFDAGTYDGETETLNLRGGLATVGERIGDGCIVAPTVPTDTPEDEAGIQLNISLWEFAESRAGTQVPEWAGVTEMQPELVSEDGVTPTDQGAEERARLLAAGVEECLESLEASKPKTEIRPQPVQIEATTTLKDRMYAAAPSLALKVVGTGIVAAFARSLL